jgi:hypothetical protein
MASTYTSNSGIEKIGSGEQAGTWGTTTNNNLDIIDRAINGVASISISGTTHTLTTTDGTLSDGGFKVLVFTGALGANNTVTISPNDQDKVYLVKNSTTDSGSSGPYSVILSQGSGGNATITNGETAWVFADGAGSGAAVTKQDVSSSPAAFTVGTDLNVGDDVSLTSDAAVINFGADSDVSLTHVADTGLLLNSTRQLQFNDSSQNINAPNATTLDINATDEVEINATLIDVNGNLDVSGTSTLTGNVTLGGQFIMPDVTDAKILVADGTSYQEVAVSGDVTIANTGAVTIANNAIETAMIADNQVSAAKLTANTGLCNASATISNGGGTVSASSNNTNIASMADNGTGDFTATFTSNMSGTDFAAVVSAIDDDGTSRNIGETIVQARATSTVQIKTFRPSASENSVRAAFDNDSVALAVFD